MKLRYCIVLAFSYLLGCSSIHERVKDKTFSGVNSENAKWTINGTNTPFVEKWWTTFDDATLVVLVERLHAQSLDLKQALQRIKQSDATLRGANATRWPTLTANLNAQRQRANNFLGQAFELNQYSVNVAAAYEVDVWNRLGSQRAAAQFARDASVLDRQALAMSLTAQLVDLYFAFIEQRELQTLIQAQIKTGSQMLSILKARFIDGRAEAIDVLQQEQNLGSIRAILPPVVAQQKMIKNQLATLVGLSPHGFELDGATPTRLRSPGPLPDLGIPAALLGRRPDLKALQLRIKATDENVAAAVADRLPSFRIQASAGVGAQSFAELLDRWLFSISAGIVAPLFDGGRRAAEVERLKALLEERLLDFKARYLIAIADVENAVIGETGQRDRLKALRVELKTAKSLLEQTQLRFSEGLIDYLRVLTALQAVYGAERNAITARRQLLSQRIALYRAIGGQWTLEPSPKEKDGERR